MPKSGGRIRYARQLAKAEDRIESLEAVAAEMGVTKQSWLAWETGASRIQVEKLPRLAELLGKPISWFFDGLEPEPTQPRAVAPRVSREPPSEIPSERFLLQLLQKQQDLISEQTALMERHRQDTRVLADVLSKQQDLLISERTFQQKMQLAASDRMARKIDDLTEENAILKAAAARPARSQSGGRPSLESSV